MFGGLDICGLDVVKLKNGEEVILEINGKCGYLTWLLFLFCRYCHWNLSIA
jgi:D-alanine-D-alanine ligase-like ATP-grasp enzyme